MVDHYEEAASENKCLELCQASVSCTWYTFEKTINVCLMFHNCSSIDESCTSCTSGESGCNLKQGVQHGAIPN